MGLFDGIESISEEVLPEVPAEVQQYLDEQERLASEHRAELAAARRARIRSVSAEVLVVCFAIAVVLSLLLSGMLLQARFDLVLGPTP